MKKIIADIHTHTLVSGHAYGTIREMAQAASEQKLEILGLTEHGPGIPGTMDPFYYCNLGVIPRTLYGVQILHGCEINVLNDGTLSLEQRWIDRLDYGIAGIHCQCYEDAGIFQNTRNLIQCIKNEKIRLVSHPDDDHTPLDYQELVQAAKEYHVALEVNNSSFLKEKKRLNCLENYEKMLDYCQQFQVPIVLSSDAHDPSGVGQFAFAEKFIEELGFDTELILNTDREKLLSFLLEQEV